MKKVILITENLGSGGAERQMVGLAALLKERGYDVIVVTYLKKQFYEYYLKEHQVTYLFVPNLLKKTTRVPRLVRLINQIRPDVVISFLPQVNISLCLARLFTKFKLIVSERSHTLNFGFKTRIQFLLYKNADYVVANSYSEAMNITQHFDFLKHKTLTIPNFVDSEKFQPAKDDGHYTDFVQILSVGRVVPTKNVLLFLDSLAMLKREGYKFQSKWVGNMYDKDYCSAVQAKIKSLHLENDVSFQGQTDNIASEYQSADIFCLPSFVEGYPNVIVEAMSCGLPIACSDVFDNPRIIVESKNGFLFNPKSTQSIMDALRKCLSMTKEERTLMGNYNRECILSNNSSEAFVEQYIKVINA